MNDEWKFHENDSRASISRSKRMGFKSIGGLEFVSRSGQDWVCVHVLCLWIIHGIPRQGRNASGECEMLFFYLPNGYTPYIS